MGFMKTIKEILCLIQLTNTYTVKISAVSKELLIDETNDFQVDRSCPQ